MKRLTKFFQALLGVAALILTAVMAFGRLVWRQFVIGGSDAQSGFT